MPENNSGKNTIFKQKRRTKHEICPNENGKTQTQNRKLEIGQTISETIAKYNQKSSRHRCINDSKESLVLIIENQPNYKPLKGTLRALFQEVQGKAGGRVRRSSGGPGVRSHFGSTSSTGSQVGCSSLLRLYHPTKCSVRIPRPDGRR